MAVFKKGIKGIGGLDELERNLNKIGKDISEIENAFVAVDRKVAPHAHWVEYGTQHTGAKSFFRPGIKASKRDAFNHIGKEIGKLIEGGRSNGKDIMLEGAKMIRDSIKIFAPVGSHAPHLISKTSDHVIYPGDLKRSIVSRKFGKRSGSGIFA